MGSFCSFLIQAKMQMHNINNIWIHIGIDCNISYKDFEGTLHPRFVEDDRNYKGRMDNRRRKIVKLQVKNDGDINCLGEDLVAEILSKLPVKSLLRSRSVSKSWYALTKTHYFIQKHVQGHRRRSEFDKHHPQRPIFGTFKCTSDGDKPDFLYGLSLLKGEKEETIELKLPFVPDQVRRQLLGVLLHGSSNGLIFLTSVILINDAKNLMLYSVIVWNPATQQYRIVPEPNIENTNIGFLKNEKENIDELGEDSIRALHRPLLGFHFINHHHGDIISSSEYIVARVFGQVDDSGRKFIHQAQIFVQNTNSWRKVKNETEIELEPESCISIFPQTSVTLNGVLYWKIQREVGEDKSCSVMSFDLRDEVFKEIQIPIHLNNQDSDWSKMILFSWKNSLATAAIHYLPDFENYYIILWTMSTDKSSNDYLDWSYSDFKINKSEFQGLHVFGSWKDQLIIGSSCRDGDAVDEVLDPRLQRTLFSYDPEAEIMTKILKDGEKIEIGHGILDYVEHLTPV